MKPQPTSVHPCWLLFQALATAFLLSLATGVSHGAGPPAGSAPGVTDTPIGAAPSATDNTADAVPSATDNASGAAPSLPTTPPARPPPLSTTTGWTKPTPDREGPVCHRCLVRQLLRRRPGGARERPESILRWKSEFRWDEEEDFSFRSSVRASLRLPRLKDRWRLVFTSESRGDPTAIIPEIPGIPAWIRKVRSGPAPRH